jgi:hypothetical protein
VTSSKLGVSYKRAESIVVSQYTVVRKKKKLKITKNITSQFFFFLRNKKEEILVLAFILFCLLTFRLVFE